MNEFAETILSLKVDQREEIIALAKKIYIASVNVGKGECTIIDPNVCIHAAEDFVLEANKYLEAEEE